MRSVVYSESWHILVDLLKQLSAWVVDGFAAADWKYRHFDLWKLLALVVYRSPR